MQPLSLGRRELSGFERLSADFTQNRRVAATASRSTLSNHAAELAPCRDGRIAGASTPLGGLAACAESAALARSTAARQGEHGSCQWAVVVRSSRLRDGLGRGGWH